MGHPNQRLEGAPPEHLQGSVERVTFHSPESGFCVLQVKVRGQLELVTVVGSAASITPSEYVGCTGAWSNDCLHGFHFKSRQLRIVPPTTRRR
jgi:exodeoxyribonuclease V alpha subunit